MTNAEKLKKCGRLLKKWERIHQWAAKDAKQLMEELRENPNMEYATGQHHLISMREDQCRDLEEFGKQLAKALGSKFQFTPCSP